MAQKTKEELKEQSISLLADEGSDKNDWIDTFATEEYVNRLYSYKFNPTSNIHVHFYRQGNIVEMTGSVTAEHDIHHAQSLGIQVKNGYQNRDMALAFLMIFDGRVEHEGVAMSMGQGFHFLNMSNDVIQKGQLVYFNCVYHTEQPFPDDSDILNPSPIQANK